MINYQKEISQQTIARIRQVARTYQGSEFNQYVPLSGAIAVVLKEEIEDREFLEFAIENHTRILDLITKKTDHLALIKDGEDRICFVVDGHKVNVYGE
jgi:hypothetical protein